ncbi:hypothetical protein KDJ56_05780 [Brevibacillus composti]|uniref:DUF4340 domain-containing protein n=1 Tax=Brevibacillus composti TaxID=2796470 RepID=A0A7T5JPH0_9BACL|nr:hypothetical protein [Brevibacillus composti]QQE75478.1 hypothetical protein JD108_06100 [Brevibacillus composti]QUO42504.1 hypothetical protein KDJ56_05780 [Brevibacillus composti]
MNRKRITFLGLALLMAGTTLFISNQINATEDPDMLEKARHQSTLQTLGIDVEAKSLENLNILIDRNNKKWIYADFTERPSLDEKIGKMYSEEVQSSFIEVQDKIMQKYAQVGDQIPIILLDEELKEGTFSFTRKSGETLSFKIQLDPVKGKWTYKERD